MDRRVKKTRESIRTAYIELMREHGGSRVTVTEIARRADIDRKTFYLHYDTTDDIMKELAGEKLQELVESLKESGFFETPLRLDYLFSGIQGILEKNMDLYRFLARDPNCVFFWDEIRRIGEEAIVGVYRDRVTVTEEELRIYIRIFLYGLISMYLEYLTEKPEMDLEMVAKAVVRLAQKGIMDIFTEN